ncbi:unnamed protein product [Prorocentrum cordatum]|uniref:Uncharacterized protein n=1 Tax=Prorocentrum cordatum TaxID=2364126 RepID=A0ABN9WPN5_9DINO|nr:unnamed protein product [Polarella glacialis]
MIREFEFYVGFSTDQRPGAGAVLGQLFLDIETQVGSPFRTLRVNVCDDIYGWRATGTISTTEVHGRDTEAPIPSSRMTNTRLFQYGITQEILVSEIPLGFWGKDEASLRATKDLDEWSNTLEEIQSKKESAAVPTPAPPGPSAAPTPILKVKEEVISEEAEGTQPQNQEASEDVEIYTLKDKKKEKKKSAKKRKKEKRQGKSKTSLEVFSMADDGFESADGWAQWHNDEAEFDVDNSGSTFSKNYKDFDGDIKDGEIKHGLPMIPEFPKLEEVEVGKGIEKEKLADQGDEAGVSTLSLSAFLGLLEKQGSLEGNVSADDLMHGLDLLSESSKVAGHDGKRLSPGVSALRASARSSAECGSSPSTAIARGGSSRSAAAKTHWAATAARPIQQRRHATCADARRRRGELRALALASSWTKIRAFSDHLPPTSRPRTTSQHPRPEELGARGPSLAPRDRQLGTVLVRGSGLRSAVRSNGQRQGRVDRKLGSAPQRQAISDHLELAPTEGVDAVDVEDESSRKRLTSKTLVLLAARGGERDGAGDYPSLSKSCQQRLRAGSNQRWPRAQHAEQRVHTRDRPGQWATEPAHALELHNQERTKHTRDPGGQPLPLEAGGR